MEPLPRVMPALITPFTADGEIDANAHVHNLGRLASSGVEGVVLGGSTGEGPYLELQERGRLAALTREAEPALSIVSGINAETVRTAIDQIDEVADHADAVLVITPTTLARNRHSIVGDFYEAVADAARVPVLLYTVPPVTGYELPVTTIRSLAAHRNIAGMKDSGGNTDRVGELADEVRAGFSIFIGASRALHSGVGLGAFGAITASANYAFPLVRAVVDAARAGEPAAQLQARLARCSAAVESHGVPGTKAAAGFVGLEAGYCRAPLAGLDGADLSAVAEALRAASIAAAR